MSHLLLSDEFQSLRVEHLDALVRGHGYKVLVIGQEEGLVDEACEVALQALLVLERNASVRVDLQILTNGDAVIRLALRDSTRAETLVMSHGKLAALVSSVDDVRCTSNVALSDSNESFRVLGESNSLDLSL